MPHERQLREKEKSTFKQVQIEKIYLPAGKTPQVLLLGNGLNRCFGGNSWEELIKSFPNKDKLPPNCNIPYLYQVILATNRDIETNLEKLLNIGFSDILTTNYSYELEQIYRKLYDNVINKMNRYTEKFYTNDNKYKHLLYKFKAFKYKSNEHRIWHIHGEALIIKTIIIGQYFYSKLSGKIQYYIQQKCRGSYAYKNCIDKVEHIQLDSWIDYFIVGDVYVLGFGFDLSEMDLWWLLNRKKREKANPHGKVYFYEPMKVTFVC